MGMLDKVTSGIQKKPYLGIIFGISGVGKTTWAANAPKPIFLGKEDGSNELDVSRFPIPNSYSDIMQCISELTNSKHPHKTLVLDSLDWIEPLVWEQTCQDNGWKDIESPGYAKGYVICLPYWQTMIRALEKLREKTKMNIIILAHSQVKPFNDPLQLAPYDRYILKLHEKAGALWKEFVDFVGFATFEVFTKSGKDGKTKAFGEGERILLTEWRPTHDAKNRLGLPYQLPLSFPEFEKYANQDLNKEIGELCQQLKDQSVKERALTAIKEAKDEVQKLIPIRNHLRKLASGSK